MKEERYLWMNPMTSSQDSELVELTVSLDHVKDLWLNRQSFVQPFVYHILHAMIMLPISPNVASMIAAGQELAEHGVIGFLNERGTDRGSIHVKPKAFNNWTLYYSDASLCIEHKLVIS